MPARPATICWPDSTTARYEGRLADRKFEGIELPQSCQWRMAGLAPLESINLGAHSSHSSTTPLGALLAVTTGSCSVPSSMSVSASSLGRSLQGDLWLFTTSTGCSPVTAYGHQKNIWFSLPQNRHPIDGDQSALLMLVAGRLLTGLPTAKSHSRLMRQ